MALPPLRLGDRFESYISGDVIIHNSAVLAPGVIIRATGDSKIMIGAGVCIGMGTILQVETGILEIGNGANLGAGVLIIGAGIIGENACIGAATTIYNSFVLPTQIIPPGSMLGNTGRQYTLTPASEPEATTTGNNTGNQNISNQNTSNHSLGNQSSEHHSPDNQNSSHQNSNHRNPRNYYFAPQKTAIPEQLPDVWDDGDGHQPPQSTTPVGNQVGLKRSPSPGEQSPPTDQSKLEQSELGIAQEQPNPDNPNAETPNTKTTDSPLPITESELSSPNPTPNQTVVSEVVSETFGTQIYGQTSVQRLLTTLFPHRQALNKPPSDDDSE